MAAMDKHDTAFTQVEKDYEAEAREEIKTATGCMSGRNTELLVARLLRERDEVLSTIADRDATIARYEATAREIRSMCYEAAENGSLPDKQHALRGAVNLANTIAPKPFPMTAEEALASAITGVLAGFEGPDHAASYANMVRAELDKLGFAVVAKGDAK